LNILFVANRFPYPPYRGDKLKIFNLAKRLSEKHDLFLLTFVQDKKDYKYVNKLNKYFKKIELVYLPKYKSVLKCALKIFSAKPYQVIYFGSKKFSKMYDNFISKNHVDVVHTQHLRMSQYSYKSKDIKRVLDLPDAYSLYWKRRALLKRNFFIKMFDRIEYNKVIKFENIINEFDLNLVCSNEDKEFLENYHKSCNIGILPNGVDLDSFGDQNHDYSICDRIIFTGNMDYAPNVDAVVYFAKEIFPGVLNTLKGVKFYIVGQKPVRKVLNLQSDNVIVTGFAENLAQEYNKSSIAVSPVRIGAGTLNKVLEPMAMGIPVVSTQVGFKGLGIKSGDGVILANNTEEFSDEVVKLLEDRNYRENVGLKGKKAIYENFSWDMISVMLENHFLNLLKH
jgi:sugar transferase (PEP-CTERM/EpsH1 system associated)